MSVPSPDAIQLTGYAWVPPGARGLVRDLRVRWALEEMGAPYRMQLFDKRRDPVEAMLPEQPFAQVPAIVEGDVRMFESGAICLHLAERSDLLMPREEPARARVLSWSIAALNSIEPYVFYCQCVMLFDAGKPGAAELVPAAQERLHGRLTQLSAALGDKDWLEGSFSVADLLMVTVLRPLNRSGLLAPHPALAAYVARGEARPAFQRALAAQMADFTE